MMPGTEGRPLCYRSFREKKNRFGLCFYECGVSGHDNCLQASAKRQTRLQDQRVDKVALRSQAKLHAPNSRNNGVGAKNVQSNNWQLSPNSITDTSHLDMSRRLRQSRRDKSRQSRRSGI